MKKSQLRQIIREEISRVLNEQEIKIPEIEDIFMQVNDEKTTFNAEFELEFYKDGKTKKVKYSAEGNIGPKFGVEIKELYKDGENENSLKRMDSNLIEKIEKKLFEKYEADDLNI